MKIVKPKINNPMLQDINTCLKNNEFYNAIIKNKIMIKKGDDTLD